MKRNRDYIDLPQGTQTCDSIDLFRTLDIEKCSIQIIKLILTSWEETKRGNKRCNDTLDTPLLHMALSNEVLSIDVVWLILNTWPEMIKEKDNISGYPLHYALQIEKPSIETIKILLNAWP